MKLPNKDYAGGLWRQRALQAHHPGRQHAIHSEAQPVSWRMEGWRVEIWNVLNVFLLMLHDRVMFIFYDFLIYMYTYYIYVFILITILDTRFNDDGLYMYTYRIDSCDSKSHLPLHWNQFSSGCKDFQSLPKISKDFQSTLHEERKVESYSRPIMFWVTVQYVRVTSGSNVMRYSYNYISTCRKFMSSAYVKICWTANGLMWMAPFVSSPLPPRKPIEIWCGQRADLLEAFRTSLSIWVYPKVVPQNLSWQYMETLGFQKCTSILGQP